MPSSALAEAARDPDPRVRGALTIREDLPLEVIEQLAGDVDAQVRLNLVVVARPPAHVIRRLLKDKNEDVRLASAERLPSGFGLRLIEPDPAPTADDREKSGGSGSRPRTAALLPWSVGEHHLDRPDPIVAAVAASACAR
jgi:hypothetical protein